MIKTLRALFVSAFLLAAAAQAQDMVIRAELTSSLGTDTNRKGDAVSARVIEPAALQGDILEGKVNESKAGNKLAGQAVLRFTFETLQHGAQVVPISARVDSISNSKGQTDMDEEGRVVRRSSNLVKAAGGTGLGGLIGGIAGGGKGAAVGALAGAAASLVLIEVAAQGPTVHFAAGSKVVLSAKSRSGPALASLQPNAAPPAAAAPAPAPAAAPAPPAAAAAPSVPAAAATVPAAAPGSSAQPDLAAIKADFIPGEKVIFYDDFTDMAGDEPPPHWKVRGTTAELKLGGGIRQMTVKGESVTLTPNLTGIPKNFTMETEFVIPNGNRDCRPELQWNFLNKDGRAAMSLRTKQEQEKSWDLDLLAGEDRLGETNLPVDWTQVVKLALWVQNGRVRLYVNGARIFDVNQVTLPELNTVETHMWTGEKSVGYRFARFTESTPDFSQTIASSGRYVTHGILFDTDSDRIKPESAPVIKAIARGLETNPNLKLQIEGHTDSTGNADHNLDLSKRRAEAVKAVLVSQFSVDASRLTTAGLGATKPIDSNDTPQGRAQNRRVEFVRQ